MSLLRKLWLVVSSLIGAFFGALLMFLAAGPNTPLLLAGNG